MSDNTYQSPAEFEYRAFSIGEAQKLLGGISTSPARRCVMRKAKAAKFDDIQIKNGALEQDGMRVTAQLKKVREYEAAANEKAGHELKKTDEFWVSLTQTLAEVKAKCSGMGFRTFKEMYCPDLSKSRIYQLLEIGTGKKTLAESRAEKRESVATSRAKAKVSTTEVHVVDTPVSESAEESAEQRKAKNAALDVSPPPKLAITGLAELKFVVNRRLPKMVLAEKQEFLAYVLDHKAMVGVKLHRKCDAKLRKIIANRAA
jgi:hypothetical protein